MANEIKEKNQSIVSIYLRPDELEFLNKVCEKNGIAKSAYFRGLLNAERFGTKQTEMNLDLSKNNLPAVFRKIAELEKRLDEIEN